MGKTILDSIEKNYLSAVIRPFKKDLLCIAKIATDYLDFDGKGFYYIAIQLKYDMIFLPKFKKDSDMYKGMEEDKEYTLEELGL